MNCTAQCTALASSPAAPCLILDVSDNFSLDVAEIY